MKIYKFYITFLFVFLVMNLFIFSFPKVFANNAENQSNNFYNYSIELSDLFYQYSVGDCYIQSEMDSRNVSLEYEDTLNIVVSEDEVISFLLKYKYYSDYIFTPNGTDVSLSGRPDPNMSYVLKYSTDFNDYIVEKMINYVNGLFPNSVLLSSPTTKFNCHSYAWYSHNVNSNDVWIHNPCAYYMDSDRSYERIYNPRVGDIVCYMDTESDTPINIHSGIIVDYSGELDNNMCGDVNRFIVESKWAYNGLYRHKGDECPYVPAYALDQKAIADAEEVWYYRVRTHNSFSFNNPNDSLIETSILSYNSSYVDNYKLYDLHVNLTQYYDFCITSTEALKIELYDNFMNEIDLVNLNYDSDNVFHSLIFLENNNHYYLKVQFDDSSKNGSITTKIVLPSIIKSDLLYGENNISLNSSEVTYEYCFNNTISPGLFKISLFTYDINNLQTLLPEKSIKVFDSYTKTNYMSQFSDNLDISLAFTKENENSIYVYLPTLGEYYIDVFLYDMEYSNIKISIESCLDTEIDYTNRFTGICFDSVFEHESSFCYFQEIFISHRSKIQLDFLTNLNDSPLNDDITIFFFKENYDEHSKKYYLDSLLIDKIDNNNLSPVFTLTIDPGIYYVGFMKNDFNNTAINFGVRRIVDLENNMEDVLVADPHGGYELGSEVTINKKSCNEYTITEGFTRNLYLMVEDRTTDSMSRLDYDWYSSNDEYATVTNYGTVLAKAVSSNVDVTIYAILKDDPSVVYYRVFTILNETEDDIIEIESEMSYDFDAKNGSYKLELNSSNCPFPMIRYYTFNLINYSDIAVSIDQWGIVTSLGETQVLIVGTYTLNPRVRLYIFLTIN